MNIVFSIKHCVMTILPLVFFGGLLPQVVLSQENVVVEDKPSKHEKAVDFFLSPPVFDLYRDTKAGKIDFKVLKEKSNAALNGGAIDEIIWSSIGAKYFHYLPATLQKNDSYIFLADHHCRLVFRDQHWHFVLGKKIDVAGTRKEQGKEKSITLLDNSFSITAQNRDKKTNAEKPVLFVATYQSGCFVLTDMMNETSFWFYPKTVKPNSE